MAYTTKYVPSNKNKYIGPDIKKIICRSLWERSFARYCDESKNVVKWAVEPFSILYFDAGKRKERQYFPDFFVEMIDGRKMVIEIKPYKETIPPSGKRRSRRLLLENSTYITNCSKWETAKSFCDSRGWKFMVITEHTLEKMGIKIIQFNSLVNRKRPGVEKKKVKYTNKARR